MSIVTIENLTHMYGDQINLKNISFRLLRGDHAGLVGDNGAGKSTLLKLLDGRLLPDSGRIEWQPHVKRGYLHQYFDLTPGMTINEFLRKAFAELYAVEEEIRQIAMKMSLHVHEEATLLARYGELQSFLDHSEFYQSHVKIEEVAKGLGLMDLGMERDCATLSGGQRTKLLLAKLLLEKPDVLLLDEPTNFLDEAHIEWLAGYLMQYEQAFIVISHDESFLSKVTNVIFHISQKTVKRYPGNYNYFKKALEINQQQLHQAFEKQQKEIEKLEKFIDKNRNRKAKQAKSREKKLQRTVRIDKPTIGAKPKFVFPVHHHPVRKVLYGEELQIGYEKPLLLKPISFEVNRGEKIAIIGYNGIGKSTLLKTMLGLVPHLSGIVNIGDRVKPAYFAQEETSLKCTPLEYIWSLRPDLMQKEIRSSLASSGLTELHIQKQIHLLSGGEQAKVRLCELTLTECNMLILDEPTNHLDRHAKEMLQHALHAYEGTVILVSHEPAFYEEWITSVWRLEELI